MVWSTFVDKQEQICLEIDSHSIVLAESWFPFQIERRELRQVDQYRFQSFQSRQTTNEACSNPKDLD